jgi:predicted phosphohydrolase
LEFEHQLNISFSWVLQVGDFGVWPDPSKMDSATRKHGGAGDFPFWLEHKCCPPIKTVFIKGNHEDFEWLDSQHFEILHGLYYLPNRGHITLDNEVNIAGFGGCYGPSDYLKSPYELHRRRKRHYTKIDLDHLLYSSTRTGVDVLLLHDTPVRLMSKGALTNSVGLRELVVGVRPRICFFGHMHQQVDEELDGIRCIGLNKVGCPGNLVAMEITRGKLKILETW